MSLDTSKVDNLIREAKKLRAHIYREEEAYGKTRPYSSCPICHEIMFPEDYDAHMEHRHTPEQREILAVQTAGYDWDYNVKYREKPILEEEQVCEECGNPLKGTPFTCDCGVTIGECCEEKHLEKHLDEEDDSQNLQLFPTRGEVNTAEQKSGGPTLDFPNHLFQEQEAVAQPIVGEIGDFFTHKKRPNTTGGPASESPMQTDYGY